MARNVYDVWCYGNSNFSIASYGQSSRVEVINHPEKEKKKENSSQKLIYSRHPSQWLKDLQHKHSASKIFTTENAHFVTGWKFGGFTILLQVLDNSFKAANEWELTNQCPNLSKAQSLPDKYKEEWQG